MKKKLTEEEVELIFDEENADYSLIYANDWISEGKSEYCEKVFKDKRGFAG